MNRNPQDLPIQRLGPKHAAAVTSVLCEAFFDYPVMRHVLGDGPDYDLRLSRLVGMFVLARVMRNEPVFGIGDATRLMAATIVSCPGRSEAPAEFARLRAEVFAELGADAQARYESFGEATRQFEISEPHIHLGMIGVRRAHRGSGLGRRLIERVQRLSREDPQSRGVTLTTEDAANVPLYERLGYTLVGHTRVADGLETWGFYRPD